MDLKEFVAMRDELESVYRHPTTAEWFSMTGRFADRGDTESAENILNMVSILGDTPADIDTELECFADTELADE